MAYSPWNTTNTSQIRWKRLYGIFRYKILNGEEREDVHCDIKFVCPGSKPVAPKAHFRSGDVVMGVAEISKCPVGLPSAGV